MIDHLDAEFGDGAGHDLAVEHRPEHRNDLGVGERHWLRLLRPAPFVLLDLHLDLVERHLRQLEQDERLRPKLEQLAGQLRADRAAGAGDHHHLVLHMRGEKLALRRDRIAAEQILDLDRPEVAHLDMARGDLLERGQRLHHHGEGLERLDRGAALAAQCRGHGEQHLFDILGGDHLADLAGPEHLDAMHHLAGERRVVVDEGDHVVAAGLVQRAEQLDADGAGAIDDDVLALLEIDRLVLRRRPEQHGAGPLPREADQAGGDQAVDHHHRARVTLDARQQHEQRPGKHGDDHRDIDARRALGPDEAGDELVQAARMEGDDADDRRRGEQHHHAEGLRHVVLAQAQRVGGPQRDGEHGNVVEDQEGSLEPARSLDEPDGRTHVKNHPEPAFGRNPVGLGAKL